MAIIIYITIAVIFFGLGWLLGIKNLSNIKTLTDNLEQATQYVEKLEAPNIEEINSMLNNNRNTTASFYITILHYIEDGHLEQARELLANGIEAHYDDIREDELHDMNSEGSREIIEKIETLAKTYPIFKKIFDSPLID